MEHGIRMLRNVAAVGLALALGVLEARAQAVVQGCEQLLVPGAGVPGSMASPLVLGVAREVGPNGWTTRLVLSASDEGFLCVPGAQAVAAGAFAASLSSGENVYIRGFGFLKSFASAPSAAPFLGLHAHPVRKVKTPAVTRAE